MVRVFQSEFVNCINTEQEPVLLAGAADKAGRHVVERTEHCCFKTGL